MVVETQIESISHKLFDSLLDNAIDFIEQSLDNLSGKNLKYSVINFYTSVELFLKARLMQEHWSLIVQKNPNWNKFFNGDFVSVNFDNICDRYKDILNEPLPQKLQDHINIVRKYRNKMVHFHSGDVKKFEDKIVTDLLRAWSDLTDILKTFSISYNDYSEETFYDRVESIDKHLRIKYKPYERRHYEAMYERMENDKKFEHLFKKKRIKCGYCEQESVIENESGCISYAECFVCRSQPKMSVEMICPYCEKKIILAKNEYQHYSCPNSECSQELSYDEVRDAIDPKKYLKGSKDYFEEYYRIGHSDCECQDSIIEVDGEYFCMNCFEHIDEEVGQCGYCGEYSTGVDYVESSYLGCSFCDGKNWDDE